MLRDMTKSRKNKKSSSKKSRTNSGSDSSRESSCNEEVGNSNNNNNNNSKNNKNIMKNILSSVASSTPKPHLGPSSTVTSNRYESLYEDAGDASFNTSRRSLPPLPGEFPMPAIPDIPNADKLSETQRTFILVSMAEKLGIAPATAPPVPKTATEATTNASEGVGLSMEAAETHSIPTLPN